jgi:signal peptidase II
VFWPVVAVIVVVDIVTKMIAKNTLVPFAPQQVVGDALRLTLVRNQGAAFGLYLGEYSRYIFMVLTVGALVILWRLYQSTRDGDLPRTLAIALVCAGALGNLIDRIRWHEGVVDFIDVGFRDMRWPTFNVADMAVSTGAFLLAWVLWGDDRAERARGGETVASGSSTASAAAGPQDTP